MTRFGSIAAAAVVLLGAAPAVAGVTEVAKAAYPEGPYWHGGKLYYVEYSTDRAIMVWDGKTARPFWEKAGCGASGLSPFGKGHLLVACYDSNSVVEVDGAGKEVRAIAADDAGDILPGPNDFVSDPRGGVYVTGSGDGKAKVAGAVFHISADGKVVKRLATDVPGANGIVVAKDGKTLLVAQTGLHQITGFPIEKDGTLGERKVWAKLEDISPDDTRHGPDGFKLGPDGNYYIAQNGAGRVLVADKNAKLVRKIDVPTPSVTNMAFGPGGAIFITGLFQNKDPYPGMVYRWMK